MQGYMYVLNTTCVVMYYMIAILLEVVDASSISKAVLTVICMLDPTKRASNSIYT